MKSLSCGVTVEILYYKLYSIIEEPVVEVRGILLFCLRNAWKNPFASSKIFMTSKLLFTFVLLNKIVMKVFSRF